MNNENERNIEIKKSALRLKVALEKSSDPLAEQWLSGDFGALLSKAIDFGLPKDCHIPHFDFFSHDGFPQVESEYFDFYFSVKTG